LLEGKVKREELKEELFMYLNSLEWVPISEFIKRKNYS